MQKPSRIMSRPLAARRKQGGFIQNLIIPGLLLMGAVIAVIALASNSSSSTDTSKEQSAVYASAILSQGVTIKEAAQRALADGISNDDLVASVGLAVLATNSYISGTVPTPPKGAEVTGQSPAWSFSKTLVATDAAAANIGTAAADEVVMLDKLNKNVCIRINNKLYGESVLKANDAAIGTAIAAAAVSAPIIADVNRQGGASEGCVPSATAGQYTYYKIVTPR
jgi:enamine deaminase RidA (YjgF/YER057c/UK114 family)